MIVPPPVKAGGGTIARSDMGNKAKWLIASIIVLAILFIGAGSALAQGPPLFLTIIPALSLSPGQMEALVFR